MIPKLVQRQIDRGFFILWEDEEGNLLVSVNPKMRRGGSVNIVYAKGTLQGCVKLTERIIDAANWAGCTEVFAPRKGWGRLLHMHDSHWKPVKHDEREGAVYVLPD